VSSELNLINANLRELIELINLLRDGRVDTGRVMKLIDEIENCVDSMIHALAPERVTDEKFIAISKAIKDVETKFRQLREHVLAGKYSVAIGYIPKVQEAVRSLYRLLSLMRREAPVPVILQVTPQYLREVPVPEALQYTDPMAAQIYNTLSRKGEATIEELALELKVDERSKDAFNNAISQLIRMGYVKPYLTPDNKMVLRPAR